MNYQEALETIGKTYTDDCQQISDWEEYKLLQELIDKTTICGLSLDEAIPVIEMYKQLKQTTHQIEPIQDLMMGQKGQYYINGISIQELIDNYTKFNEDKSCQYICDTKALLEEELSIVKERLSITEKALDKICYETQKLHTELILNKGYYYLDGRPQKQWWHWETWKKWALEESEKQ